MEVLDGPGAAAELVATTPADVVLNGITGSRGLGPTLAALAAGATLALANKESLVAGGPLVTRAAGVDQIVPVDSEHSALAQCLRAGTRDEVARLVLTASRPRQGPMWTLHSSRRRGAGLRKECTRCELPGRGCSRSVIAQFRPGRRPAWDPGSSSHH